MPVPSLLVAKHTKKASKLGVTQAEEMFTICWFGQALGLIFAERLRTSGQTKCDCAHIFTPR